MSAVPERRPDAGRRVVEDHEPTTIERLELDGDYDVAPVDLDDRYTIYGEEASA